MRSLAASGLLVLLSVGKGEALAQPAVAQTGRELLAAGDAAGAAEAFQASLRESALSRFTVQLAIFCDVSNLERQVRASGNPAELFVLRRTVGERPCLGLYWGLFESRAAARSAVSRVPAALKAAGQAPVAVSTILPAAEPAPPPPRVATASAPPVAPSSAPVPSPAPAVVPRAEPQPSPAPPAVERVAPPPLAEPPVAAPVPGAPSVPLMEIAAGYAYLDDDAFPVTGGAFEAGWILSGCANLNRRLGVVGEVNAQYKTQDVLGGGPFVNLGLLGVHAGLRYAHRGGLATPYVQGLAGVTRSSVEDAGVRRVEDDFSLQPGVGVHFRLSDRVGLGLGGDYRLVFGEADQRNELRFHADVVFGIGSR
jgi:hypothetical protein